MKRAFAVAAIAVLGLAAGCGDDDGEALSRDEFISRANTICREGSDRIDSAAERVFRDDEPPSAERLKEFFDDTVKPEVETRVDELRDLNPPEELEENYDSFLDETETALEDFEDRIEENPASILETDTDPFQAADDKADALGLNDCGDQEEDEEGP